MNTTNFFKNKWVGWIFRLLLFLGIADFFYLYGSALVFRTIDLLNNTVQPLLALKIFFDTAIILSLALFVYMRFVKKEEKIRWILIPISLIFIYQTILGVTTYLNNHFTDLYRVSFTLAGTRLVLLFLIYLLDLACVHFRKEK